jgi:hypothetical protein
LRKGCIERRCLIAAADTKIDLYGASIIIIIDHHMNAFNFLVLNVYICKNIVDHAMYIIAPFTPLPIYVIAWLWGLFNFPPPKVMFLTKTCVLSKLGMSSCVTLSPLLTSRCVGTVPGT